MLKQQTFHSSLDLNYVEGPNAGPPLLLLHGITQRWQEFIQIIPALTVNHHLYALDLRGHGHSARAPHGYRGEDYSSDVVAFIDDVIGEAPLVFGHSLGGMVSLYISANFPDRIRAQALGDSIIFGTDFSGTVLPSMFGQTRDMVASNLPYDQLRRALPEMKLESPVFGGVPMKMFPGCDDAYLSAWARCLSQLDPQVLDMALDGTAFADWHPAELIQKIKCPTLLIQADPKFGGLMSDRDVQEIKAAFPDVQVARLPGIGHSLHMYDAPAVIRVLTNFLCTLA